MWWELPDGGAWEVTRIGAELRVWSDGLGGVHRWLLPSGAALWCPLVGLG